MFSAYDHLCPCTDSEVFHSCESLSRREALPTLPALSFEPSPAVRCPLLDTSLPFGFGFRVPKAWKFVYSFGRPCLYK